MDKGVFKIMSIGGIAIKAHWSWIVVVLLLTIQLAAGYFPLQIPGAGAPTYLILGLIAALLLFASVLLHELSHSFMAQARGLKVRDIILFIFGGVSNIEQEPETASTEFLTAVVGPLTSLVLAGVFWGLALLVTPPVHQPGAAAAAVLQYLAFINFLLGLFNLIPGFPLDGGRVLRAIVWGLTHDFARATRIAGGLGQLVAYGFIFWGLYQSFFLGDFGGLWTAFIGWFLLNGAQQGVAGVMMRETLRSIQVGQVMEPAPPAGPPALSLAQLLSQYLLPYNLRAVPITQDGHLVGLVTLGDIKDIPQEQWPSTRVDQVMTPVSQLRVVRPDEDLGRALQFLGSGDFDQLPVIDPTGHLVGMLTRAHILEWLRIRDTLQLPPPAGRSPESKVLS